MMKVFKCCLLLSSLLSSAVFAGGDIVVKVVGINSDKGSIRLGLYDQAKYFRNEKKAVTVQETLASTKPVTFRLYDMPAGNYAIHGFHDRDGDHNFDHMLGLFPSEGYGFSQNDDLGAEESFQNSQFIHAGNSDTEVTVYMRYCENTPDKAATKAVSCWLSLSP